MAVPAGTLVLSKTTTSPTLLTVSDLTWQGYATIPSTGSYSDPHGSATAAGMPCSFRYGHNGAGRTLIGALACGWYIGPNNSGVGDLVEWSIPTLTSNGANACTEIRRWADWTINTAEFGANGYDITGLYWDAANGVVWYTLSGSYSGSNSGFFGATQLLDTDAGGGYATVGTKYGLWYYRSAAAGALYWKAVGNGIVPFPTAVQARLGLAFGLHGCGTAVGGAVPYGPNLHGFAAWPSLALPPGSVIAQGTLLADYTYEFQYGVAASCRRGNNYTSCGFFQSSSPVEYDASAGTYTNRDHNWAPGGDVGDMIYLQCSSGTTTFDGIYVRMGPDFSTSAPASGGTRILEYWNGSAWATMPNQVVNTGSVNLTSQENSICWATKPGNWTQSTINGATNYWLRLRVTSAYSVAGTVFECCSPVLINTLPDGAMRPADGATGYWFATADRAGSMVWVDTGAKHGVLCFGRQMNGNGYYGYGQGYIGTTRINYGLEPSNVSGGYKFDADRAALYIFDPNEIAEVIAGTRVGNAGGDGVKPGINPVSIVDWHTAFPSIPVYWGGNPPVTPDTGIGEFVPYISTNPSCFDETANEIIWTPGHTASGCPTVQVFSVT